ncbi:MAG TPA: twin-arginine translocase TatA/TatE family subunit [Phycisphaerae bacterium]
MLLPLLPLANFGSLFGVDGIVVLVIGLLIFGRRLPEVGKNLGKTIVEFKKGLNGTYSDDKSSPQIEEAQEDEAPPKRLASGTRVSASQPARRRLAETEEV